MSWEDQFYLPRPVATYDAADLARRTRVMVPAPAVVEVEVEEGLISIVVRFERDAVDEVAALLGSSPQKWLDFEWRDDMDPPRDEHQSYYRLRIELVEVEHHELRVASSDADNRAAWPLAFALAGRLAEELDATEDPPAPPPGEDALN